jgi:methyl-accepting chemotaxis protein
MAATIEEMSVSISQLADNAHDAETVTTRNREISLRGEEVIRRIVTEMGGIAGAVRGSATSLDSLGRQSEEIFTIVNTIKGIADQTNLLALNAAIEAARAGDQGRGFAVVADEVRSLADRTSRSTQEIATMVEQIQKLTRITVASMGSVVSGVDQGAKMADEAGQSVVQITSGADKVGVAVNSISHAIKEQNTASQDIARSVEGISRMADQNSMAVQAAAKTSNQLAALSQDLLTSVLRFQV